jgi:nitrite reductase/ring-hydroxylating ferredoxin subunit/uncharacterized membrane protein
MAVETNGHGHVSPVELVPEVLRQAEVLDRPADVVAKVASKLFPAGVVKDAVSGRWLGHPIHPLLTDIPVGAWSAAFFFDLIGAEEAADASVGLGVVAAIPAAVVGLADWSDTTGEERRVGLVHAISNTIATGLYAVSFVTRRRGHRTAGVLTALAGAAAATLGGFLGGDLVFRRGLGVDHTLFQEGPTSFIDAIDEDELVDGEPTRVMAGDVAVMLLRREGEYSAIAERCSHLGGPLHEGSVQGVTVMCPWHGSTFDVRDGTVCAGPATAPQPAFDVRVRTGKVQIRRRPSAAKARP